MLDIRLLADGDVGALHALYTECFEEPFAEASLRTLLASPGMWAALAWPPSSKDHRPSDSRATPCAPAGFAIARHAADEAEIVSIGVRPAARRVGVGAALLADVMARSVAHGAAAIFLEVAEDNVAAIALYLSAEFEKVGRRPGYYRRKTSRPVAALIMRYVVKKSVSYSK
jgi:[ribosomal protein S18]-alanine N-acetyltransferase